MEDVKEKILKAFKETMNEEVGSLDLIVNIPDDDLFYKNGLCFILEKKENGRVWSFEYAPNGKTTEVTKL